MPDQEKKNVCSENVGRVNQIDVRAGIGDPSLVTNLTSSSGSKKLVIE